MMASSSHSPLPADAPFPPQPQPPPHPEPALAENVSIPYTPTSSATSGPPPALALAPPPPHQHRKTSSLEAPRPAAKHTSRPLSLRDSQIKSLTNEQLAALRKESAACESVMVTPPENLPPSPPLTSQDTDGDVDVDADADVDVDVDTEEAADVDTEEAVDGASRMERDQEEDVADAWRHRGKPSLEAAGDAHPLSPARAGFEGYAGDATANLDLEKGPDAPHSRSRTRYSFEADVTDEVGVTKPFEVVRKPKRTTSPQPPHSAYYVGPPTGSTAFYTAPRGQIGVHHPREIIRIERDYDLGELVQFSSSYPLELQGRVTPTQFLETINAFNEGLIRAHSLTGACIDNTLAVLTLWLSPLLLESKYDREMKRLQRVVDTLNAELYNPQGLNILWPRKNAFLFLEIEYY